MAHGSSRRLAYLLAACIGASTIAHAQDLAKPTVRTISGSVRTSAGEPLQGAIVTAEGTLRAARTEADGRFTMSIGPGTWTFVARRVGYLPDTSIAAVNDDGAVAGSLSFVLQPAPHTLRAITVESGRNVLAGGTISPETMRNVPPLGEPDVFRTLVLLPGIAQPNDLLGALHLAGGASDETGVRIDGHPLQQPFHVLGALGAFNIGSLDDATVRMHELPIDVDGHLGGIVDLRTRGLRPPYNREVNVSLASVSATAFVGRLPAGTQLLGSGRATYLNRIAEAIQYGGTERPPLLGFHDALVKLRLPRRLAGVELLGYESQERIDFGSEDGTERPMEWGERLVGATWRLTTAVHGFSARVSHNAASATFHSPSTAASEQFIDVTQRITDVDLQAARHGAVLELIVGGSLVDRSHRHSWAYPGGPINEQFTPRTPAYYDRRSRHRSEALRAQATGTRGDSRLSLGARATRSGGRIVAAPRLSFQHAFGARLTASAAAERRHQYTAYLEEPEEGSILQPVYLLDRPRQVDALSLGATWRPGRGAGPGGPAVRNLPDGVEVVLFARRFPDRPLLREDPRALFLDGKLLPRDFPRFARVRADATGATLGMTQRLPLRTVGQLAYTYQRVTETYDGVTASSQWDVPHSVTLYLNTALTSRWTLSGVGQFRSGAATTPVSTRIFTPGAPDDDVLHDRYLLAPRNSARLPGYQRIDVALRRTWGRPTGAQWSASLQVVNLLGRVNVMEYDWYQYYCWRKGACRTPGASRRGLPIIPTVAFEVRW